MSDSVLKANVRQSIGSSKAKNLRRVKVVPAVLYGHNIENKTLELELSEVSRYLSSNNIGSSVYLDIEGEKIFAILKDFQRNILQRKIIHLDFQALTLGEKIKVKVPLLFSGKDTLHEGLILQTFMDNIEIQTLPKYLIDKVEIDLSNSSLGDNIRVSDLPIMNDENIEVLVDTTLPVYAISEAVRFEEPEDSAKEEVVEEVEPESI